MSTRRQSGRRAGFSLIEVLCAIMILGIGMVGLTHGLTTALSASKESEVQTAAALIAAGRIETLRADGYLVDGTEEGKGGKGLELYQWQQTVRRTPVEGLHEVAVVIQNAKSGQSVYELRTLLFDPAAYAPTEDSNTRRRPGDGRRREKGRP